MVETEMGGIKQYVLGIVLRVGCGFVTTRNKGMMLRLGRGLIKPEQDHVNDGPFPRKAVNPGTNMVSWEELCLCMYFARMWLLKGEKPRGEEIEEQHGGV